MPTVSNSFQELLRQIQPLQSEIDAAQGHISTIKARLASATKLELKNFIIAGSFSRGSYIRGKSDVDVFAVFSRDSVYWGGNLMASSTVLDNLKAELEGRFWNTTVYRDGQAIVVEFSDCTVDVVPCVFAEFITEHKWPSYLIPDGEGGWMKTSPGLHNAYIKQENDATGGKLKGTAQLLKFWRECRSPRIPVSSFHIEMVLASLGICKGVKSYSSCVTELLQNLASRECRAMQDPLRVSGYIPAVKTENQRESALSSVVYSRDHAKSALSAEYNGIIAEALRQWDIVYNTYFPYA